MNNEPLSTEGLRRRDAILLLAKAEAKLRRQRRFVSRSSIATILLAIMAVLTLEIQPHQTTPIAKPSLVQLVPAKLPAASIAIKYIQTDPTITDRLTLPPQQPRWTSIGDTELLEELAAAGQPAGIVCMNGKTFLLQR